MSECRHDRIIVYADDAGSRMWACASCAIRMYPACRTCIDVGHRNEDHVATLDAARAETPGLREAAEQLVRRTDGLTVHFTGSRPYLVVLPDWIDALRTVLAPDTEETL